MFGKNKSIVSESSIHSINAIVNQYKSLPKEQRLSIGDHFRPDFITIDFSDADFNGDVRWLWRSCCFPESPELMNIPQSQFKFIMMQHFIEHIEWIYQKELFEWVRSLLSDDGVVYIVTPNLQYIMDVYLANIKKLQNGKSSFRFPKEEHPELEKDTYCEFIKWINYKIFSGGSPADHHGALYDRYSMDSFLRELKFANIKINSSDTLSVIAYKNDQNFTQIYTNKIKEVVGG